jgi:hypothetical protein
MLISYPADRPEQASPRECVCRNRKFHRNGRYYRIIASEWVYHFICTACGIHISMVPSTCVPYKHHPASVIQFALDNVLEHGRSGYDLEREGLGVHGSCVYRWVKEFSCHIAVLATEGARRLRLKPFSGSVTQTYQKLRQFHPVGQWLRKIQPSLCTHLPPLGIFRPLIL